MSATESRMFESLAKMLENPRSRVWRDDEGSLLVDLNDFFAPAADAEEIPTGEIATVVAAWERRGWWGILDWVIQRRYVHPAVAAPRDAAFQRLWTKYAALPNYDKSEWTAAFNEIWETGGLVPPQPDAADQPQP